MQVCYAWLQDGHFVVLPQRAQLLLGRCFVALRSWCTQNLSCSCKCSAMRGAYVDFKSPGCRRLQYPQRLPLSSKGARELRCTHLLTPNTTHAPPAPPHLACSLHLCGAWPKTTGASLPSCACARPFWPASWALLCASTCLPTSVSTRRQASSKQRDSFAGSKLDAGRSIAAACDRWPAQLWATPRCGPPPPSGGGFSAAIMMPDDTWCMTSA